MSRPPWPRAWGPLLPWLLSWLLSLPACAGGTTDHLQKERGAMPQLPLLQTLEDTATRPAAWINGFPADWLLSVRAGTGGRAAGLGTPMAGYATIHPYFLRPGANELRVELAQGDAGRLAYRVASLDYTPDQALGTVFADHELLRLATAPGGPRRLAGTFEWAGVPAWTWTRAPAIADTMENRQGLRAAVERFRAALDELAGDADPASPRRLAQVSRASMREFIQASELRGPPFTLLDELIEVSSTLKLAGDQDPEAFLAGRDARERASRGQPSVDDAASPHPPVARLANGELPARLSLRRLESFDGLVMTLFADGRLARLTDRGGKPVIQFVSNYSDGPRGSPRPVRFSCDPWFRQNARHQWELDAIYPSQATGQVLADVWPQQLLEQQPY